MHVDVQPLRASMLNILFLDAERYNMRRDPLVLMLATLISVDAGNVAIRRPFDLCTSPYNAPASSVHVVP